MNKLLKTKKNKSIDSPKPETQLVKEIKTYRVTTPYATLKLALTPSL